MACIIILLLLLLCWLNGNHFCKVHRCAQYLLQTRQYNVNSESCRLEAIIILLIYYKRWWIRSCTVFILCFSRFRWYITACGRNVDDTFLMTYLVFTTVLQWTVRWRAPVRDGQTPTWKQPTRHRTYRSTNPLCSQWKNGSSGRTRRKGA